MEDYLPVSYRAAEVSQIMAILRAGESCTIIGASRAGKSKLLRFLEREDVRQANLGPDWASYVFAYIDANKMPAPSLWAISELVLHQLGQRLAKTPGKEALEQKVSDLHRRVLDARLNSLTALRYLDRAIALLCGRAGLHLVLLLDAFDDLCQQLSTSELRLLRTLRDLRDDNKYCLMYVVAARRVLKSMPELAADIEPVEELVSANMIWLGPIRRRMPA